MPSPHWWYNKLETSILTFIGFCVLEASDRRQTLQNDFENTFGKCFLENTFWKCFWKILLEVSGIQRETLLRQKCIVKVFRKCIWRYPSIGYYPMFLENVFGGLRLRWMSNFAKRWKCTGTRCTIYAHCHVNKIFAKCICQNVFVKMYL